MRREWRLIRESKYDRFRKWYVWWLSSRVCEGWRPSSSRGTKILSNFTLDNSPYCFYVIRIISASYIRQLKMKWSKLQLRMWESYRIRYQVSEEIIFRKKQHIIVSIFINFYKLLSSSDSTDFSHIFWISSRFPTEKFILLSFFSTHWISSNSLTQKTNSQALKTRNEIKNNFFSCEEQKFLDSLSFFMWCDVSRWENKIFQNRCKRRIFHFTQWIQSAMCLLSWIKIDEDAKKTRKIFTLNYSLSLRRFVWPSY